MMNLYSIKDVKSGFMSILVLKNDDVAKRSYKQALNMPESPISQNPEDYELWCLGTYDQDNGQIVSDVRFVASAISEV